MDLIFGVMRKLSGVNEEEKGWYGTHREFP
jgi:hypothetical protein